MSGRTSYPRPWTVSIDDVHCRAVIRDKRGVVVVYIQDVLPSRAREDAQMLVDLASERDELRDLCVLLFDAVKYGNQVVDLPGIWNKAKEVLSRTDPEDKQ